MKKRSLFVLAILLAVIFSASSAYAQNSDLMSKKLLITGFQVSGTKEYVELYNPGTELLSIEGWKVTYTNANAGNLQQVILMSGFILPNSHVLFSSTDFATDAALDTLAIPYSPLLYSGMADSGGFLRLYEKVIPTTDYPDGFQLLETVGWKNTSTTSLDLNVLSVIGIKSVKRCTDLSGQYVDRQNNQTDFYISSAPELLAPGLLCTDLIPTEPPPLEEPIDEIEEPPSDEVEAVSCEGVVINEILPNASGDDSGKEFIELYNSSTSSVDLKGCILELENKQYIFANSEILLSGAFIALDDGQTGITLPNSSGGIVRLVSLNGIELSTVMYPQDLDDDQSWALIGSSFLATYMPTPTQPNIDMPLRACEQGEVRDAETNYCNKIVEEEIIVCSVNQVLNPDTNRCNKIEDISLATCKDGQERNPQTNRCRNIVGTSLASALTPCLDGQFRNPDTNRCKAISSTTLVACKDGQERNAETNRCRTIVLASSDSIDVEDIESVSSDQKDYLAGVVVGVGALSYGVYEWRSEITSKLKKLFASKRRVL